MLQACSMAMCNLRQQKQTPSRARRPGWQENVEALKGGVELIYGQMKTVLENFGLKEVLAVGAKFDPTVHEAISRDESTEYESDIVIKEFQKGYFLKDRLLRPSMVSVAE